VEELPHKEPNQRGPNICLLRCKVPSICCEPSTTWRPARAHACPGTNPSGARAGELPGILSSIIAAWCGWAPCHCHARAARIPRRSVHPSVTGSEACRRACRVWTAARVGTIAAAPHARPVTHMPWHHSLSVSLSLQQVQLMNRAGYCLDGIHGPDGRTLFLPRAMISGPLFCSLLLLLLQLTACSEIGTSH
jgi:hypothetical protein